MGYTAYFDRNYGTVHGAFTLQRVENGLIYPVFKRLPAASGQARYTKGDKEWVTGKSPIPMGTHWLSTKSVPLLLPPVGTPFYPIGTEPGTDVILGKDGKKRTAVGLHMENALPGSAGCIVLDVATKARKDEVDRLFKYLDLLNVTGVTSIKIVVL